MILKVQAEDVFTLDTLWSLYKDGTLKESLQAFFVNDKMREFAGEEQVEVIVTIDEEEYEKVRTELIKMNEAKGDFCSRIYWQLRGIDRQSVFSSVLNV